MRVFLHEGLDHHPVRTGRTQVTSSVKGPGPRTLSKGLGINLNPRQHCRGFKLIKSLAFPWLVLKHLRNQLTGR